MRNKLLAVVIFLISTPLFAGPKIHQWTSDKGVRVFYVHAPGLPLLDMRLVFDAGSVRDGEQYGIASMTADLLGVATRQWNADQIAERLEGVGANLSSGASRDLGYISLRCLTQDKILKSSLQTLEGVLTEAEFPEADFKREKARTLVGLKHREESPRAIATIKYYNVLYGEHPYAHPSAGNIDTVKPLTADDLRNFYQKYYVANNATAIIVGDVSRQKAADIVDQVFAKLPAGVRAPKILGVSADSPGQRSDIEFPSAQTHIYSGAPVLSRHDDDYFALYVGNHILGGSGLISRISDEVREKRGLSYSAYSYFSPMAEKGPFTMGLQTRNDQAEEALKVLNQTVADFVENGPTDEELRAAKKNITGGFVLRIENNSKITGYTAMIAFYGLALDYLDTFNAKVEAVSREDIMDAFKRRVKPSQFKTVLVGGKGS